MFNVEKLIEKLGGAAQGFDCENEIQVAKSHAYQNVIAWVESGMFDEEENHES